MQRLEINKASISIESKQAAIWCPDQATGIQIGLIVTQDNHNAAEQGSLWLPSGVRNEYSSFALGLIVTQD